MEKISIAQGLKNDYNKKDIFEAADNISVDEDQDYDNEETTFTFKDGSRLSVSAYFIYVLK